MTFQPALWRARRSIRRLGRRFTTGTGFTHSTQGKAKIKGNAPSGAEGKAFGRGGGSMHL